MGLKFTAKLSVLLFLLIFFTIAVSLSSVILGVYTTGEDRIEHRWHSLVPLIEESLFTKSPHSLDEWLPAAMISGEAVRVDIYNAEIRVYSHQKYLSPDFWERIKGVKKIEFPLPAYNGYRVSIVYNDPILNSLLSIPALLSIGLSIMLIFSLFYLLYRWLSRKFDGLLMLEQRSLRILSGEREDVGQGSIYEWPCGVSGAIDRLLADLRDMNDERIRVDKLIRAFAAQDAETGLNNRLFFDNQLATQLEEFGAHGVVMMVRIPEFDALVEEYGKESADELLYTLVNMLSTFVMRYPAALLARYFSNDFSVLLPHRSSKEAETIAAQLVHAIERMPLNANIVRQELLYIGMTKYHSGMASEQVMSQAEQAARNAELEGGNGWFIYDESNIAEMARGSVRWRTLLEHIVSRGGIDLYFKPAVDINGKTHHLEMMGKIQDGSESLQPAEFMPLVQQFGLTEKFDRQAIAKVLALLAQWPQETAAVTITVDSLLHRSFQVWLRDILLEREKSLRHRIIFELAEVDVCQYSERLRPVARLLNGLGCRLAVVQAGLTVVSTKYIKILPLEMIKLHPGLVRNINRRPENQLFVDSLVSAIEGTNILVYAASVRTLSEWQTLRGHGIAGGQGEYFASPVLVSEHNKKEHRRLDV